MLVLEMFTNFSNFFEFLIRVHVKLNLVTRLAISLDVEEHVYYFRALSGLL